MRSDDQRIWSYLPGGLLGGVVGVVAGVLGGVPTFTFIDFLLPGQFAPTLLHATMLGAFVGGAAGVPLGVGVWLYRRTPREYHALLTRNVAVAAAGGAMTAAVFSVVILLSGKAIAFGLAQTGVSLVLGLAGGALVGLSEGDKAVEAREMRELEEAAGRDEVEEAAEEKFVAPAPDVRFTNTPRRPIDPRDLEDHDG